MENKEKTKHKCHHEEKNARNDEKLKDKNHEEKNDECSCQHDKCECHQEEKNSDGEEKIFQDKIKQLEEALLRSQAELLNYRKRKDEETSRIIKYAEEDILKGFLPILDNFERAIDMDDENLDDEVSKFLEGFKLMYKQIKELLSKFEVVEIEALDKEFDPTYHQAVVMEKDDSKPSGIVTNVLQKGYMYKDRILRTAMVKVNE